MSLLPLIAIAFAGILVIILLKQRVFARKITAPSCPRCFYNVTGLLSNICPECGAKLNEVGVLQPGHIKPMGRLGWIAVWTCAVAPIALIATPLILQRIPRPVRIVSKHTFARPSSGLYQSIVADADLVFRPSATTPNPLLPHHFSLTLTRNDQSTSTMTVDFQTMTCSFKDASGKPVGQALTHSLEAVQTILDWYAASGVTGDITELRNEVLELVQHGILRPDVLGTALAGRSLLTIKGASGMIVTSGGGSGTLSSSSFNSNGIFRQTSSSFTTGPYADPWPPRLIIGGWIALWLIGIVPFFFLVGRASRRQMAAVAQQTSGPIQEPALS